MLITPPTIAKLVGRTERWAQLRTAAGHFGPVMRRHGEWQFLDLANVEADLGRTFSPEQVAAAQSKQEP
jgi:hypothetical protein